MKCLTVARLMNQKQVTGKYLIIVFFFINQLAFSQCVGIRDLFGIYDDSYVEEDFFIPEGTVYTVPLLNYSFDLNARFYSGSGNSDRLYSVSNSITVYYTQNSSCYSKIKASVAKEVGLKVKSKVVSEVNGVKIESFEHISRDLAIEFHQLENFQGYNIVILNSVFKANLNQEVRELEQRVAADKKVVEFVERARASMELKKFDDAETLVNDAKLIVEEGNTSQSAADLVSSFDDELKSTRFQDASASIYKLLNALQFIDARNLLAELKQQIQSNPSKIVSIEKDLKSKATNYYNLRFIENQNSKNYYTAIVYADSILLFDATNSNAITGKKEMQNILAFLKERKTTTYEYWKFNPQLKSSLLSDYKEKCLKLVDGSETMRYSFDLLLETDTSCGIYPSIRWNSNSATSIDFANEAILSYNILPFEKYGYCVRSGASLSFQLTYSNFSYQTKYVGGNFIGKFEPDERIIDFMDSKFPEANGKLSYTIRNVDFNGEKSKEIYLTKFETRGPLNSLLSFIVPGLGSLRVSYGKKGWVSFSGFLFSSGLGLATKYYSNLEYQKYQSATSQTDIDKYYGNANTLHKIALISGGVSATIYVYDIIWAFSKGCKNRKLSKPIRKMLNQESFVIKY